MRSVNRRGRLPSATSIGEEGTQNLSSTPLDVKILPWSDIPAPGMLASATLGGVVTAGGISSFPLGPGAGAAGLSAQRTPCALVAADNKGCGSLPPPLLHPPGAIAANLAGGTVGAGIARPKGAPLVAAGASGWGVSPALPWPMPGARVSRTASSLECAPRGEGDDGIAQPSALGLDTARAAAWGVSPTRFWPLPGASIQGRGGSAAAFSAAARPVRDGT